MTTDHRLIETRLAELADLVDWPEADLAGRVQQRILSEPTVVRRPTLPWKAAAAVLAMLMVILAVPASRQAVADLLGVAGIEIAFIDDTLDGRTIELHLGEPVSRQYAMDHIAFSLALPLPAEIGDPTAIYQEPGPSNVVHATWEPGPDLPEVGDTGIGLLLTQFEAPTDQTVFTKELLDSTAVELTRVGDAAARWIDGAPHQLTYETVDGTQTREISRLAGNVLIWESDGVTYRLESALDLASSMRIAEALAPVRESDSES